MQMLYDCFLFITIIVLADILVLWPAAGSVDRHLS